MRLSKSELISFFGKSVQDKGKKQEIKIKIGSTALGGRKIEVQKGKKTAEISINDLIKSLQNVKEEFKGGKKQFNKIVTDLKSIDKEATEQFNANVDKKFFSGVIKIFHSIRHLFGKISLKSRDKALEKLPFEKAESEKKSNKTKKSKEDNKTSKHKTESDDSKKKSGKDGKANAESDNTKKKGGKDGKTKTEPKPSKKTDTLKVKIKDLEKEAKKGKNKKPMLLLGDPALNQKIGSRQPVPSNHDLMRNLQGNLTFSGDDKKKFEDRLQTFKDAGVDVKQRLLDLYPNYNGIYQKLHKSHPLADDLPFSFNTSLLTPEWGKSQLPLLLMYDDELSQQSPASLEALNWNSEVYPKQIKELIESRIKALQPSSKKTLPDLKQLDQTPFTHFKNVDKKFFQKNLKDIPLKNYEYFDPDKVKTFDLTSCSQEQIDALRTCLPLSDFEPKQINQILTQLTPGDLKKLSVEQIAAIELSKLNQESFQALFPASKEGKKEFLKNWSVEDIKNYGPQLFSSEDWPCAPEDKLATYVKDHFNELTPESFNAIFDMKNNAEWARNLLREISISTLLEKKELLSKEHWTDLSREQKIKIPVNEFTPLIFESFFDDGENGLTWFEVERLNAIWTPKDVDTIENCGFFHNMHWKSLSLETKEAFLDREGKLTQENFNLFFNIPNSNTKTYQTIEKDIQSWKGDKLLRYFPFLNNYEKSCLTKEQLLSISPAKLDQPTFQQLSQLFNAKKEGEETFIQNWSFDDIKDYGFTCFSRENWVSLSRDNLRKLGEDHFDKLDNDAFRAIFSLYNDKDWTINLLQNKDIKDLLNKKELLLEQHWQALTAEQKEAIPFEEYNALIFKSFFNNVATNPASKELLNQIITPESLEKIENSGFFNDDIYFKALNPETKEAYLNQEGKLTQQNFKSLHGVPAYPGGQEKEFYDALTGQIQSWQGEKLMKYLPFFSADEKKLLTKDQILSIDPKSLDQATFLEFIKLYEKHRDRDQYIHHWSLDDVYAQKEMLKATGKINQLSIPQRTNFKKEELDQDIFDLFFEKLPQPLNNEGNDKQTVFNNYWSDAKDVEACRHFFNRNHFLSLSPPTLKDYLENHSDKETFLEIFKTVNKPPYLEPNLTIRNHLRSWSTETFLKHIDAIDAADKELENAHTLTSLIDGDNNAAQRLQEARKQKANQGNI